MQLSPELTNEIENAEHIEKFLSALYRLDCMLSQDHKVLYRGQLDFPLRSTLHRKAGEITVSKYQHYLVQAYHSYFSVKNEVFRSKFTEMKDFRPSEYDYYPPNYEFMVLARHLGFPSPILDFTRSLYVALFFAYQKENTKENGDYLLYYFLEQTDAPDPDTLVEMQQVSDSQPVISKLGPHMVTHERHHKQSAEYLIAFKNEIGVNSLTADTKYCSHEESGEIKKITLPKLLRNEVLSILRKMNINSYTLYGSDESLMEKVSDEIF